MAVFHDVQPLLWAPAPPKPVQTIGQPVIMHGTCDPCCRADHKQADGKARQAQHEPGPGGQSGQRAQEGPGQTIGPTWMSAAGLCLLRVNAYRQAAEQADRGGDVAPFWKPCVGVRH